jgi:CHAT domain-containing protein
MLRYLNRDNEALDIYKQTSKLFQENAMESDAADCMRKISRIVGERGDTKLALEMLVWATHVYKRKGLHGQLAQCDWESGELLLKQGRYGEAYSIFRSCSPSTRSCEADFGANFSIGEALRGMGRLQEAREFYVTATESLENFMKGLSMTRHRHFYGYLLYELFVRLVAICVEESDFECALEYVERSKNRGLTEMLLSMNNVPAAATDEARREFKNALVGLRAYGRGFIDDKDFDPLRAITTDLPEARLEYQDVSSRLKQRDPKFTTIQDSEISWEGIRALADEQTALIEVFPMEDKTTIFVVKHDSDLRDGTIVIEDYGFSKLFSDSEVLRNSGSVPEVKKALDSILKRLYETIFVRIEPLVAGKEHLIFIPSSEFHLVPWHALYCEEKGRRRYVIDNHLVSYAPNAQILRLCLSRNPPGMKKAFVGHANPDKKRRLRYSGVEANAIARLLGVKPVFKSTKRDVIEHGGPCDVLHYTGHANSESLELHAEQSIEDKELLHLSEIVERLHLPNTDLAVLSACETGKIRVGFVEEYVGLTSGFLMAGAATVVCSLWPVSDLSTCLLMGRMYSFLRTGVGKAQALKDAQLWLRDSKREDRLNFLHELGIGSASSPETASIDPVRFTRKHRSSGNSVGDDLSHPYYWAGFICTGAP